MSERDRMIHVIASQLDRPNVFMGGPSPGAKIRAEYIYDAIRDELAGAKRLGWIAGRDAAADLVLKISQQKWAEYDVRTASMSIRNMEPPA